MKNLCLLLLFALIGTYSHSQIVTIPDANFKAKLLASTVLNSCAQNDINFNIKVDANDNGEIEVNELLPIVTLDISQSNITTLAGIEFFLNLKRLYAGNNLLSTINSNGLNNLELLNINFNQFTVFNSAGFPNLKVLHCSNNLITSLNLDASTSLLHVNCDNNQISSLNLALLTSLESFSGYNNQFTSFDFSNNPLRQGYYYNGVTYISKLSVGGNPNLNYINFKNGTYISFSFQFNDNCFSNLPNLEYICIDEISSELSLVTALVNNSNVVINSYCSFVPGGNFYSITGNTKYDLTTNGCDSTDINYSNLNFTISNGIVSGSLVANTSGNYSIPVQAGSHTITPVLENPSYFIIFPTSINVIFPDETSPFTQDFCVTANGIKNDLEITIIPIEVARPGFDAHYKIVYKNKGNQVANGALTFGFDDMIMDLVSSIPTGDSSETNSLNWNFTDLNPFETGEIDLVFTINSPIETPAVNSGDILFYTANIAGATDETPNDNTFTLNQTAVNSYDPNDKTCLEGTTVAPDMIGQYVHYVIRFENTGTFPAENIVVKDMIDLAKFDISTLIPLHSSHDFVTRINGNKVEFIFEGINLPFDDATNDGYIAFKIKTKSTLVLGDTFTNSASIYFDYNFPIITNTTATTVAALNVQDFDFTNYFTLYPNPAKEVLNVQTKGEIGVKSVTIYNMFGQMVLAYIDAESLSALDVSPLKTGTYFIKITTDKGTSSQKFIKE